MGDIIQQIEFEKETIGHILKDKSLFVPRHQRPYKWVDEHVNALYKDLRGALGDEEYFLGSIVVVKSKKGFEVNDGQQRLATSLILIAAIRDYFFWKKDTKNAKRVETQYLLTENVRTDEVEARLHLSGQDHEIFLNRVLRSPDDELRKRWEDQEPTRESNKRILKAAQIAKKFVKDIAGGKTATPEQQTTALWDWLDFLVKSARVMWVEVSDARTAYLIFETMNDRGLDLSSADLLKNRLLAEAGDREDAAFEAWQRMLGKLEKLSEGETAVVDYIRYLWISTRGHVRTRELYDKIKTSIKNKTDAMNFASELENRAGDYTALYTPTDDKWNGYGATVRNRIQALDILGAKQVRTMLLAALPCFSVKQMSNLLWASVCWSVRFLVTQTPSGNLEAYYGKVAIEIKNNKVRTADGVTKLMLESLPDDEKFQKAFETLVVSQPPFVTYYLRTLQLKQDNALEAEYSPSETSDINREHIMPEILGSDWSHIPQDQAKQFLNRLGNQVLMKQTENSAAGNSGYPVKKKALLASKYSLTKSAGEYKEWTLDTIRERQALLAALAVKAWPLRH